MNRPPRALDAGFDRLTEALRTVEDHLRFDRSLQKLPARWKTVRGQVNALRQHLETRLVRPLALARDCRGDAGSPTQSVPYGPPAERSSDDDLLAANLARARESARSVEEHLRLESPELAATAERLRYGIYELESCTLGLLQRRDRLASARLYVLLTSDLAAGPILEVARATLEGGAQVIQLREKTLPRGQLLVLARQLRELTLEHQAVFLINDAVDIAALAEADGVHQGQEDLRPAEVRKILGPEAIVGISTHEPAQARQAELDGADYIGVGPVFPTRTKEHRAAVGLPYIAEAMAAVDVPAFAIGSVNRQSLPAVIAAGAQRVAVCTGIIAAEDVVAETRWFRQQLDRIEER